MIEKSLVGGAEIVQTIFAVGGFDKAMLRAFAVAGEAYIAAAAIGGQRVRLVIAELLLLG